ncbi:hypothetical protein B0H14DRAFT_44210 [Mycena olivaceomarginata]|nr:hypothetical protein B0H14DRAFT_44210 [Mycena olivaceomarginata]
MDTSESMSQNSGKQLNNWPLLAGLVLLLYDYLLTLPTEICIVWPRPRPWLLLIRYLALGTNLSMVVLTFGLQVCDSVLRGTFHVLFRTGNGCRPFIMLVNLGAKTLFGRSK